MSKQRSRPRRFFPSIRLRLTYSTDPSVTNIAGPCAVFEKPAQVCTARTALLETLLHIPLQFQVIKNPVLTRPLIAHQYYEVQVNLDIKPMNECLWAVSDLTSVNGAGTVTSAYQQSFAAAALSMTTSG